MPKSFKSFTKEYALGLQVPAMSYLKPTASMNLQAKKKIKKEKNMNWITSRIKEKSSQGGVALIAMGLVVIFLGGFVNIAAYAAIAYGAYQLLSEG